MYSSFKRVYKYIVTDIVTDMYCCITVANSKHEILEF